MAFSFKMHCIIENYVNIRILNMFVMHLLIHHLMFGIKRRLDSGVESVEGKGMA